MRQQSQLCQRKVNDISSGIVNNTHLVEETASPEAECADGVGEGHPERDEDHPGEEVHAAEIRTSYQNQRNSREDKLEIHHCSLRDVLSEIGSGETGFLELVVMSTAMLGLPTNGSIWSPKPIRYPQSTQQMRTMLKA